jgi:hypothetical protein
MLAISRFRFDEQLTDTKLTRCLEQLGQQPGFRSGRVGRAIDDPTLWVLQTIWADVGSYRRALSAYDVKMNVVPVLANAIDEPSAYEIVTGDGATYPNVARSRQAGAAER